MSKDGMGLLILGEILRDQAGLKDSLAAQDLTRPEGVNLALSLQGQIVGLNRVIDRLFEMTED